MSLTLSTLRSTMQQVRLQSPDIIFWFEHTAFPILATRKYPNDHFQHTWTQLQKRRLVSITTGFAAKGESLQSGFAPVSFSPPLTNDLREIRIVRFIPDSGEMSIESAKEHGTNFSVMTMNCKMKSAAVVAKVGDINEDEREIYVDGLFDMQITLHSRKIEF